MAYTSGNLALQPKRKPERQPTKEKKRVVKVRKTIPAFEMLLYLGSVVAIVALFVLIIFHYAQNYRMELQINKMDSEYKEAVINMKVLQAELAKLSDPDRIRALAIAQGMVEPDAAGDSTSSGKDSR